MMNRRPGGLAALVAGAALMAGAAFGLAACTGTSTPHVASLHEKNAAGSVSVATPTVPAGSPARLLDEWASCMRSHGDPGQIDPTVAATKVIQITLGTGYSGEGLRGQGGVCGGYLSAAQTALGGRSPATSSDASALKFAQCMRANGVPDYPDPTGTSQVIHASSASDLNPANPTFQAASTLCADRTGYQSKFSTGAPQPGSLDITMAGGFGGR